MVVTFTYLKDVYDRELLLVYIYYIPYENRISMSILPRGIEYSEMSGVANLWELMSLFLALLEHNVNSCLSFLYL